VSPVCRFIRTSRSDATASSSCVHSHTHQAASNYLVPRLPTRGSQRNSSYTGPGSSNRLPNNLRAAQSLDSFRRRLEETLLTFLYKKLSYCEKVTHLHHIRGKNPTQSYFKGLRTTISFLFKCRLVKSLSTMSFHARSDLLLGLTLTL